MNTDNMIVRGQIEDTRDGGPQQTVKASGRAGETYGGQSQFILRIQAHGFAGHAPPGSQGVLLIMGGNPDMAMLSGGEHPDHRPQDLEQGASRQYDTNGNFHAMDSTGQKLHTESDLSIEVAGNETRSVKGNITAEVGGDYTLNANGTLHLNVSSVVITANRVVIDAPDVELGGEGGAPVLIPGPYPLYAQMATRVRAR
jgi:phage gp45-like